MTTGHRYQYNGTEVLIAKNAKSYLRWSVEPFMVLKVGTGVEVSETRIVAIQYDDGVKDFIANPIDSDFTEV